MSRPLRSRWLGSFALASGHLRITDPFHAPGFSASGVFAAIPGRWVAMARKPAFGERDEHTWELLLATETIDVFQIEATDWKLSSFLCNVRSEVCGAIDDSKYPPEGLAGTLESTQISAIKGPGDSVILSHGVFVSSGKGNGAYDVYVFEEGPVTLAARVVFLEASRDTWFWDEASAELAFAGD